MSKFITLPQLAEELGTHPQSIRRWIREDLLVPTLFTPGGQPRFILADILKQLKNVKGEK